MKRTTLITLIIVVAGTGFTGLMLSRRRPVSPDTAPTARAVDYAMVAAAGRVEPISEEIKIGAEVSGKLKLVPVEEGSKVRRGQILAVLENSDFQAQVASAEAQLREREAELRRVVNGARDQERREAKEAVDEAEATMDNARVEMERRQVLFGKGVIAREEANRAERDYQVARARREAARQRLELINDEAREEDRAKAQANVALSLARLREAQARADKTIIRSPIDGVVLRKHLKAGESVANTPDMPIVTVGNTATLRVRAEVDETDIGKVRLGQKAYVTADAFGDRRFTGRVVRIGQTLGKKNVRTDKPAERVDTKVLEALIDLDDGRELPTGLRVDTFIITGADKNP